jgi:hypothetical protein
LIPAQWGNAVTDEILNVIQAAGLTPDEVQNNQLLAAIRLLDKQPVLLNDTGVANAYTATNAPALTSLPAKGFVQRVVIANANTGPSTYAPDGLAARPIYGLGLQPLQGGELPAGIAVLMYLVQAGVNGGNGAWVLIESLGGSAQIALATKSMHALQFSQLSGVVGSVRNAKMSLTAASALATFTADEVIVETALGGLQYRISNFNKTINVSTVGAGGMDTGVPSASGFVSIYAIYNPTTQASALLACIQPVSNGSTYTGANMPAGYTASALVASWPITAASILSVGFLSDRTVAIPAVSVLNSSAIVSSQASLSITNAVPLNARSINGYVSVSSTSASNLGVTLFSSASVTGGAQPFIWGSCPPNALQSGGFSGLQIALQGVIGYTTASTVGTPNFQININSYTF